MDQPPGSTTDSLNVRPYDAFDKRERGGQRGGISKFFAEDVLSPNSVQRLTQAVIAFDPSSVIADTLLLEVDEDNDFVLSAEVQDHIDWTEREVEEGGSQRMTPDITTLNGVITTESHLSDVYITNSTTDAVDPGVAIINIDPLVLGTAYIIQCEVDPPDNAATAANRGVFGMFLRVDGDDMDNDTGYISVGWRSTDAAGAQDIQVQHGVGVNPALVGSMTNLGSTVSVTPGTPVTFEVRVNGSTFNVYIEGNFIGKFTSSSNSNEVNFGFYLNAGDIAQVDNNSPWIKDIKVYTGIQPASLRESRIIAVSGGSVFSGSPLSGLSLASGGTGVLNGSTLDMGMQPAFQKAYMCDGLAANYKILTLSSNTISDWASAITGGSLPAGSVDTTQACRFMQLYRGRIAMSGLREDPQNWFLAKSGDPLDWDYSPATSSALQAVAGNNSNAGLLGDVVTALCPYLDDVMLIGGATSLWIMRGDPAAGGLIDNVSRTIGIIGPDSWCWDSVGIFYFMAVNGLYRLTSSSGTPELISKKRLDKTFGDIDIATNRIMLVYDPHWQGVHIFISPQSQPTTASTHWWWDERTDSFHKDQYPIVHGPTSVLAFEGDIPSETAILMGGYDSFVRQFDETVFSDDGTNINSFVRFTPIVIGGVMGSSLIDDINLILDQQSDNVTIKVWSGDTVEEAERLADAGGAPRFSRIITSGRNSAIRNRRAANAFIIELSQNGTAAGGAAGWAYEAGVCRMKVLNRMRGRHVS